MTEAANGSEAPNIYREGAIFLAVGAVFATAGSLYLAARQSFFGSQGDVEQLIWQARNLVHLMHTGDPIVRDAFYGTPTPYAYMPTSIGVGGFVALVRGATGSPWFAHNLGLSLGLVANFVAAYICFRKLEVDRKPATLGAWVYMLAPQTLSQAISGHMWFSWTFLIPPLFLLVAGAGARVKSPRWWIYLAVVTSFFLWFHEYFWLFACVVGLVAAVVTLARKRPVDFGWIAGAVGVALLITGPALWLHIERRSFDESHNIKPVRTIEIAKKFSSDPADFLQPVDRSSLYLDLPKALTQESRYESINYLGLVGMLSLLALPVLIARGRLSAQQRRFLLATAGIAVAGVLFSLGPRIPTEGDFPGLSAFFYDHDVWPANQIAAWSRYGIFAFMWVASVVAFVYQALTRKLPRIWATVALLLVSAIVIFDQYPHFDLIRHETRVPEAMISTLERSPRDAYVMHLPLDGFGGVEYNAVAEFFQTFHERPIVNGYTPAINPAYVNLMRQAPIGCLNTYAVHPCPSTTAIGRYLEDSEIEWIVFERFRLQTVIESTQQNPLLLHRLLKMIEGILNDLQKGGSIHTEYSDERYVVYRVNHP